MVIFNENHTYVCLRTGIGTLLCEFIPNAYDVCTYSIAVLSSLPELNECDPNPCLNDGTCVDGVQNYTCTCASFTKDSVVIYYTGRNCSTGQNY